MNKIIVSLIATLMVSTSVAQAGEVRVYNWSDYIDESLIKKFEQETGDKLIYDVFDTNELLETKLLAGGSGYDVVVPSASFLQRQINIGVFQKLDYAKLSNASNLWSIIKDHTNKYDPDNAYSINYMWGTTGIGINVDKVKEVLGDDAPVNSLALIFDPKNMKKLAACGVHLLDAPAEMIPAALKYIGEDPDSKDLEVIAKVEPIFAAIRPYVTKFHSSEYVNALANGDICVAFGYSGDILQSRDRAAEADNGVKVTYNIASEGAVMWFDQMAIPADAPNPEGAHKFLNFMLDANNMATASNYVYYANGNLASQKLLEKEVLEDEGIYPTDATLNNLFTTTAYGSKVQRKVTRMWTKIKSGT